MRLRPFALAVFCSIAISSFPCPAEAGNLASAAGKSSSLIDDYRLALSVDPDNPLLHFSLGSALMAEGLDHEAIAEFRQAYSDFNYSPEMNYHLGLAYGRTGDLENALRYLDQAEALGALEQPWLFPLADDYYAFGLTCLEADDLDAAAGLFARTLALDPERQEIRRQLAEIYARLGRIEESLTEFEAYLKIYPDDVTTREYVYTLYFNRARQSLESRNYRTARRDFNKALDANPGSPLAIYYIGYLDYSEGDHEGAAARLAKIYQASPAEIRQSMDSLLHDSARALLEKKKFREALIAAEPLTTRQPPSPRDIYLAGSIHLALKEFEAARDCFESVLAIDPSHQGVIINITAARSGAVEEHLAEGRVLFRQSKYMEALQKFEAALAIDPSHPIALARAAESRTAMGDKAEGLFLAAEQSLQQGRPHEALEMIGAALALEPDSLRGVELRKRSLEAVAGEITEALGRGARLVEEGRLREAESALDGALQLDPSNEEARDQKTGVARLLEAKASEIAARGNLALEDGRLPDARRAFEASLKLVPELREGKDGLARIEVLTTAMISEEVQWSRRARSAGRLRQARGHLENALRLRDDSDLGEELEAINRSLSERRINLIEAARKSLKNNALKRAEDYFRKVLALYPQQPDALRGLEEVEERIIAATLEEIDAAEKDMSAGQFQVALARYRRVLGLNPSSKKALEGLDRAMKKMEGDLDHLIASGNENLSGGLLEDAEIAFREALALDPCHREARTGLRRLDQLRNLNGEKTRRRL